VIASGVEQHADDRHADSQPCIYCRTGILHRTRLAPQCAEPRAPEIASCNTLGGKHKAESGHLDSAVDPAAMPLARL
jgi:hypothetical protein